MKHLICLILCSFFVACGQGFEKDPAIVDAELLPYSKRFEQEIGVSTTDISIVFDNLDDDTVGLCIIRPGGNKIIIDLKFWQKSKAHIREEVMYHELGHCAMGLDHDKSVFNNNCPKSIMYPYVMDSCYLDYPNFYKEELRSKKENTNLANNISHHIYCKKENIK